MSLFSDNLRYLRSSKKLSQKSVSENLGIERGRYAKYEEAKAEPRSDILLRIGRFYHISLELLIGVDLSRVDLDGSLVLKDNRIILPMKVNGCGENMIEIIPHAAKAGYLMGYSDPEFIDQLQVFSLPFLRGGKYRAFPIEGDSMPPHEEGSFIIGKNIESLDQMKNGKTFLILTMNEGITYKRLVEKRKSSMLLSSDNPFYKPYSVKKIEILEVWQFELSISTKELALRSVLGV